MTNKTTTDKVARKQFTHLDHVLTIDYWNYSHKESENPGQIIHRYVRNTETGGCYWNYYEDSNDKPKKELPDAILSTEMVIRFLNHHIESGVLSENSFVGVQCENGYTFNLEGKQTYITPKGMRERNEQDRKLMERKTRRFAIL